jgi:hypothetical protein
MTMPHHQARGAPGEAAPLELAPGLSDDQATGLGIIGNFA